MILQDSKPKRPLKLPVVIGLLLLTAMVTALSTLLIARFWIFQPAVGLVVLAPQERTELSQKLSFISGRSSPYYEHDEHVIYLTERELNAMVAQDSALANRAFFHLLEDKMKATLLIDVPLTMPLLAGQTVKATTGIIVGYADGRPTFIVADVSLMGFSMPSAWLVGIKGQDLVQLNGPDSGIWHVFREGVRDLRVEQGRLRIELAE